jgi:hypothetical protein
MKRIEFWLAAAIAAGIGIVLVVRQAFLQEPSWGGIVIGCLGAAGGMVAGVWLAYRLLDRWEE